VDEARRPTLGFRVYERKKNKASARKDIIIIVSKKVAIFCPCVFLFLTVAHIGNLLVLALTNVWGFVLVS
jgi:hypothetical protein